MYFPWVKLFCRHRSSSKKTQNLLPSLGIRNFNSCQRQQNTFVICRVWKEVFSSQSTVKCSQNTHCPTTPSHLPKTDDQKPISPWLKSHTKLLEERLQGIPVSYTPVTTRWKLMRPHSLAPLRHLLREGYGSVKPSSGRDGKASRDLAWKAKAYLHLIKPRAKEDAWEQLRNT